MIVANKETGSCGTPKIGIGRNRIERDSGVNLLKRAFGVAPVNETVGMAT